MKKRGNGRIEFIKAFMKNPRQIGTITQSSRFLIKELVEPIDFQNAKCIVEFGAGTGCVTKKIAAGMKQDCVLLCFEVEPLLVRKLKENIQDKRVKIIEDSAENFGDYLGEMGFEKADYIVSGLPLTSLPKKTIKKILNLSLYYLKDGGRYIQFQYSLIKKREIEKFFPYLKIKFVFLNLPPAFVLVGKKYKYL